MFSTVTRTNILNASRISLRRPIAASSVRAFIATPKRSNAEKEEESQATVAERARKNRPISPNLGIYKLQMTMVLSALHRNTGVAVAGSAFLYTAVFGLAPALGLDLGSVAAASAVAATPTPVLLGLKALISGSLSFHCFNGIRHLVWDTGRYVSNKGVINTGYVVIGATALATGYLTLF
ncbi:cytochrome b subunit of succinate dehydrogenase, Sdh3p [Coemansia sp. IMI 209127]|nr:cytochrome b subunit of succinate dehydrogenase, Sdh3p [Coemansia sp. IMI 209127]